MGSGGAGAAIGSAFGGPLGGIIGGGMGMSGEGADRAAQASGRAALAAETQAIWAQNEFRALAGGVQDQFNRASVAELSRIDDVLRRQDKNLSRQEQLISQIDPTIIEASQQALRLLRGEESPTLSPLRSQRAAQRQKVVDSLRQQMGPGAETSTAGIQALTRFDSETANILSGAQQGALSGLGGLATQFTSTRPDMLREILGYNTIGGQRYDVAGKQADLGMAIAKGIQGTYEPIIQRSGAGYTADVMRGQQQQAMGNQLMETGIGLGGQILGGAIKGAMK